MLKDTIKVLTFFLTMFIGAGAYSFWYVREDNSALIEQLDSQTLVVYQRPAPAPIADFEPPKLPACENPNPEKHLIPAGKYKTIENVGIDNRIKCGVLPVYSPTALKNKISGQVVLNVFVTPTGEITVASVKSGNPLFYQAAAEAARQTRTETWILGGRPVNVSGTLTYDFDYDSATANLQQTVSRCCTD